MRTFINALIAEITTIWILRFDIISTIQLTKDISLYIKKSLSLCLIINNLLLLIVIISLPFFIFTVVCIYNMGMQCFEGGCAKRVAFVCRCTKPKNYSCDDHYAWHLNIPVSHKSENLIVQFSSVHRNSLLYKLTELISYFQQ